jgi:hypothetical protein
MHQQTVHGSEYEVRLDEGETESVKNGRRIRHVFSLPPIVFNLYSEYLTTEATKGFGDFKIGGQVIYNVKSADDLVPLAKEEAVLQGMIERLTEIGRLYRMGMNVERT